MIEIILESLSPWFVHPGALLPFIFILTRVRTKEYRKPVNFLLAFLFDYNDVRAFEVFKWTAGCIIKCEKTKTKLAKNIKKKNF